MCRAIGGNCTVQGTYLAFFAMCCRFTVPIVDNFLHARLDSTDINKVGS